MAGREGQGAAGVRACVGRAPVGLAGARFESDLAAAGALAGAAGGQVSQCSFVRRAQLENRVVGRPASRALKDTGRLNGKTQKGLASNGGRLFPPAIFKGAKGRHHASVAICDAAHESWAA